jgi:hypothetical protein
VTRRQAWLAVIGLLLTTRRMANAAEPGVLTIDLNQWDRVVIRHGTETITARPQAIFAALKETNR